MRNSRNDCKADTSMQPKIPNGRVLEREVFPTKISHFYVIPIYGILMLLIVQRKIDGNKKFVRWRLVHRMRWWYCIIRYTNRPNYIGDVVRFDEFSCDASDRRAVDFAVVTLYDSTGTWVFSTKNVRKRLLEGTLDRVGASWKNRSLPRYVVLLGIELRKLPRTSSDSKWLLVQSPRWGPKQSRNLRVWD